MAGTKHGKGNELVLGYLENISSKVFSNYPKEIADLVASQHGVYALYKGAHLYYVGLATNLKNRVKHHNLDKHAGKWDKFSLYLVRKTDHIKELESLLLRIADPKGNAVKGNLPHAVNLRTHLKKKIQNANDNALDKMMGQKRKTSTIDKKKTPSRNVKQPALEGYVKKSTPIRVTYKDKLYKASIRRDGTIYFGGKIYNSPSHAGHAIIGRACSGWLFWRYRNSSGEWVRLNELRKNKK